MDNVIDFYKHPVTYIRQTQRIGSRIHDLLAFFIESDDRKKFLIHETFKRHKGDSVIIITNIEKDPISAWFIKTEDIGEAAFVFNPDSYMPEGKDVFLVIHITDDDLLGFGSFSYESGLQFASIMPRADWFLNIEEF